MAVWIRGCGLRRARRLGRALPAAVLAAALWGAAPIAPSSAPAQAPQVIFEITNIYGVSSGPTVATAFTTNQPWRVVELSTYHWNAAKGATPGTISVDQAGGTTRYGPFPAVGHPGQGGVPNAYWIATVDFVLPPGSYIVVDSDPATWSQNVQSGNRGFAAVKGLPAGSATTASVAPTSTTATVTVNLGPNDGDRICLAGDIDNLNFGFPAGFDVFSGRSTPVHSYPWKPNATDAPGTDRIMVGTGATSAQDGYAGGTSRPDNLPQAIRMRCDTTGVAVREVVLQLFVDDFQAPVWGSKFTAVVNGRPWAELAAVLNSLNQTGPIGRLITLQVPADLVAAVLDGDLLIDDATTGKGDGYAVDFARVVVNPRPTANQGEIAGRVLDAKTKQPLAGARVRASSGQSATTASDGRYVMQGVPAGRAAVTVQQAGYADKTATADLIAGQRATIDLELDPVPGAPTTVAATTVPATTVAATTVPATTVPATTVPVTTRPATTVAPAPATATARPTTTRPPRTTTTRAPRTTTTAVPRPSSTVAPTTVAPDLGPGPKDAERVCVTGDVDNFGFGVPAGFDLFSGRAAPAHRYPWVPEADDAPGTDRIMVGSAALTMDDAYARATSRPGNRPDVIALRCDTTGLQVRAVAVQLFVDGFEAPLVGSRFGVRVNGRPWLELAAVLNSLRQSVPSGRLVTAVVPPELADDAVRGELAIDDATSKKGDGFAVDFVRILVNPASSRTGTVVGTVRDARTKAPVPGAVVTSSGGSTATAGADGSYTLPRVPAGLAVVTVRAPGYAEQTVTGDLRSGGRSTIAVALAPAAPPSTTAPPVSTTPPTTAAPTSTVPVVPGDCDGDGKVTANDARCILRASVGLRPEAPGLDVDGSGSVDSRDATLVLRQVVARR